MHRGDPAALCALLGTRFPIVQAPMAGVQGSALALAVSHAGGLGSLPAAMLTPAQLRAELALLADARVAFNVNFFCHPEPLPDAAAEARWRAALAPYFRELGIDPATIPTAAARAPFGDAHAQLLEEFRPRVVSFHFGLPSPALLARVKAVAACVVSSATTVEEARWLEEHGADAIIAQGVEAGGHRGMFLGTGLASQRALEDLLPAVVAAVRVPVIAAGGIARAADVRRVLALGAAGAQAGTAYLLSPEALTSRLHRTALEDARARETALTNLFTGRPARSIVNRLLRELGPINPLAPAFPLAANAIGALRAAAERGGSADFSPLWAGTGAPACRALPAAEITREFASAFVAPAGDGVP